MARLAANPKIKPVSLFAARWLGCAAIVFAVYNPSGNSYWHWLTQSQQPPSILQLVVGIGLVIVVFTMLRMAFLALRFVGTLLAVVMVVAGILFLAGLGWLDFTDVRFTVYLGLFIVATVLAAGLSWPFYQRAISGERDILRLPP